MLEHHSRPAPWIFTPKKEKSRTPFPRLRGYDHLTLKILDRLYCPKGKNLNHSEGFGIIVLP